MEQTLTPGELLRNGSYRIEKILGQGGFGITYLATDLSLDRKVAVKEFFPKDYCDRDATTSHVTLGTHNTEEFVNRLKAKFLKEAKNIAKFDNPGIIKIHAAFEENNTAYYVMDFIEGESLSQIVKRNGPLPKDIALRYITQAGQALDYVHSHRMNHLDVKPANIMVRQSDDTPILIDFGLSKQYDSEGNQTSTTPTGISHGYAPMEQYNDGGVKEFSPQTDIYSLAATLYYLLSGVVPPQATRLVDDELTFPASIPPELIAPITKAMSTARRNRHSTVSEFLDDLRSDDATQVIAAPATPTATTVAKEKEKRPAKDRKPAAPAVTPAGKDRKNGSKSRSRRIPSAITYVIAGIAALTVILFTIILTPREAPDADGTDTETAATAKLSDGAVNTVTGMYYKSSLGPCSYTGEVDAAGKPHGKGRAIWEAGLGKSYDGNWVHGVMEGHCHYVSRGDYIFEGKFKNGHYSDGKLISPDKSYYVGTFDSKGEKWSGVEYDAGGRATDTWRNGE